MTFSSIASRKYTTQSGESWRGVLFTQRETHWWAVHLYKKSWFCLNTGRVYVAANCHLCLHACNRSLFALALSIDSRAYVTSQHVRWPIRVPLPICANQDAWVVIMTKWPKANYIHTATRNAWTRTPPRNFVHKAVLYRIHFPASFTGIWPSCHFDLGGSRHGWGLFLEQTEHLQNQLKLFRIHYPNHVFYHVFSTFNCNQSWLWIC